MDIETKDSHLALDAVTAAGGFTGLASVFGNLDRFNDVVEKGAFRKTLAAAKRSGQLPRLLWQHRTDQPIGTFTSMVEPEKGLVVEGKFTKGVQAADEARRLLRDGALSGLSIGFAVRKNGATVDRKTGQRRLHDLDLMEVSIVTFPANSEATVSAVKSADPKFVERILRDAGLSRRDAKGVVARGVNTVTAQRDADDEAVLSMVSDLKSQTAHLT